MTMLSPSTTDATPLKVPAELMAASRRMVTPKREQLHVEAFRVSWLTRLTEMFVGRD